MLCFCFLFIGDCYYFVVIVGLQVVQEICDYVVVFVSEGEMEVFYFYGNVVFVVVFIVLDFDFGVIVDIYENVG